MRGNKTIISIIVGLLVLVFLLSFAEVFTGYLPVPTTLDLGFRLASLGTCIIIAFGLIVYFFLVNSDFNHDLYGLIENELLSKEKGGIPESQLLFIESNLDRSFNCNNGSYHIIVISSCVDTNEKTFMRAIWDNISNGVRYLYITPEKDYDFIKRMLVQFSDKKYADVDVVYEKVINNIIHICDPNIFEILPQEYDLCIYMKDVNERISKTEWQGYCSTQYVKDQTGVMSGYYFPISEELFGRVYKKYADEFYAERIQQPYYSSKVTKSPSQIHGTGLFCKRGEHIRKDEVVIIKGGHILHYKDLLTKDIVDSSLPIGDDLYIGAKTEDEVGLTKIYINHSCNPNLRMKGERAFSAIRDISEGEELTIDYAFVDNKEYYIQCNCKSSNCRKIINGLDWQKPEVRKKYNKDYFSKYIQSKIQDTATK